MPERHPLAILNTTIITVSPGTYATEVITVAEARAMVRHAIESLWVNDDNPNGIGILSAIGHQSTAEVASLVLGTEIRVNRIEFEQQLYQTALVFKLRGRPEEGRILSREEIDDIGFDLIVMRRIY